MFDKTALRAAYCVFFVATPVVQVRADAPETLPDIVITADRVPEPIGKTGSSITVVPAKDIEKYGTTGLADVLRDVPGLQVNDTGGVGAVTTVSLRGAGAGRTLILLDGLPIGDPTNVDNSLDLGNLSAIDVERIEVLRGPQSALYGSDAMGGVINIITRKGAKAPRRSVTVEAGSYGTFSLRGDMSGGDDRLTYSLGASFLHTDGFPRYGYRIGAPLLIGDGVTPLPAAPSGDPTDKGGFASRISYKLSDWVTIDASFNVQGNAIRFDNPGAVVVSDVFNTYNHSTATILDGFLKATIDPWNGQWKHQLTVFGNLTDQAIKQTEACYDALGDSFNCLTTFRGGRFGAEYQSDVNFGSWGALTYGGRTMTETASTGQNPNPNDGSFTPIAARQTTNSGYGEYRYTAFQHLDLTLGGRIDAVASGPTFGTWRATAAYRFDTGTKLRASAGTGAKVPTLYQRFSPYGTAGLVPETNFGYDVGVDQQVFNGRATLSASYFTSDYRNLINFANVPICTPAQAAGYGCYYNVGRARTQGAEVALDATLVPDTLRLKGSYTYTDARDLTTGLLLLRQPLNRAALSLTWTPTPQWEIESRLSLVGDAVDANFNTGGRVSLPAYAKLDVYARYKFTDHLTAFTRVENLTNESYEEAFGYGVAGRSIYAGVNIDW